MESSYIGLVALWSIFIVVVIGGYILKHNDRNSDANNENNSEYFPYLTVAKSEHFYGLLLFISFGLVIYSSLLVANVV